MQKSWGSISHWKLIWLLMILKDLLGQLNSTRVTVNYDIGNSASLGYDPEEELNAYGPRISDIHIKDRILDGGPVKLGTGNADFPRFFLSSSTFNYNGPFIMQAYRDDEGVNIFQEQLRWVKPIFGRIYLITAIILARGGSKESQRKTLLISVESH